MPATARSRAIGAARSLAFQTVESPGCVLAEERVVTLGVPPRGLGLASDIPERHERVAAQVARVVPWDEQPVVTLRQLLVARLQPVHEGDVRLSALRRLDACAPLFDPAVPRADVLADVAAVNLIAQLLAVGLRNRSSGLRPVGKAAVRVEHAGLVERSCRAGLDAERAGAAVEAERRRRLELDVGDERSQHDPRAETARDQHRVLAVEADAGAGRGLPVDVLVGVDQHGVGAAEPPPELVEPLSQHRVGVEPRVARQPAVAFRRLAFVVPVAERRRDDGARAVEQLLRMARNLGLRRREAHVGEEPARLPLPDVPLGALVRGRGSGPDDVEANFLCNSAQLNRLHMGHCARMKAVRIHEDGGPEVLRYEDAPDPEPGPGEVVVRLRAASLNHLDLWIRKGLPSVPKPRILGADGAGIREDTGEAVVINPGIEHGDQIVVVGEHMDGTHAELVTVPEANVYPLPHGVSFEAAAAFPLVFETAYRLLVTKAQLREGEWVLLWGIGSGVATAGLAIAKALGARALVTSSSDEKLERARGLGADAAVNHATGDVRAAVKETTGGAGVDVVLEHVGEATWATSLQAARAGGRIAVCGATTGPNPPAALHRIWWKQLTIYGSTMGTREDFEAAYELVKSGRAAPVVDSIRPLAEARAAHERMEAGEQFGKLVLSIP